MSVFQSGDRVVFVEEGYPLTGKRGSVTHGSSVDHSPFAITVTFDNGLGTSTWRSSFFSLTPDAPSSIPPACGAV